MNERAGYIYGIIGVVIFGLTLPATRIALISFDPWFIALGRAVLAGLAAAVLLATTRQKWPPRSAWLPLLITALGVVLGFPLLATIAMQSVPASHGGVVLAILPLATAVAGVLFAREKPSAGFWLCSLAGTVAVLAFAWAEGTDLEGVHYGDLFLAAAVICAAAGYATGGKLSRTMESWQVISWALVLSAPLFMAILVMRGTAVNWNAPPQTWAAFGYLAFFSQFLGFFAWYRGLALGGVAKVGQIQLLQTFVTLIAAALLLGEQITWLQFSFTCLVVVIVAVGRRMRVS